MSPLIGRRTRCCPLVPTHNDLAGCGFIVRAVNSSVRLTRLLLENPGGGMNQVDAVLVRLIPIEMLTFKCPVCDKETTYI